MMEPIAKRVAGLDIHKMMIMVTILIEHADGSLEEKTKDFKTFRKDRELLRSWLTSHGIELVVMESTGVYWKSIYSTLEEANLTIYVVNARYVKQVPGRKTDVLDSQWLASLARFGLLKPSFIPPKDLRELRLISRQRMKTHSILAAETNRLHKVLDDAGVRLGGVVSDLNGVSARAIIHGLIDGKSEQELKACVCGRLKKKIPELMASVREKLSLRHLSLMKQLQEHIYYLEQAMSQMDEQLFDAMIPYQTQWELLQTLPGVDRLAAAIVIIEIGIDMERFGCVNQFASWAGMCPGNNESAGKRKSGAIRKGNRALRRILCEIANAARRTDSQFKGKYQGLVIRRGHKRSIIALGHKILRIIYVMLKNNQPYQDPKIDYSALVVQRNAPRWIQALNRYGYLGDKSPEAATTHA